MPHHRVTSFFRSSNESINNIKASVQRRRSPSSRSPAATPREGTTRTISYASSIEDNSHPNTTNNSAVTSAVSTPSEDHTHSGFHSNFWAPNPPVLKMPESKATAAASHSKEKEHKEHQHHRLSLPGLHFGASKSKEHAQHPNASLDWKIESPPVVLHGDAENSTGALVSGQLLLGVKDVAFEVESFEARLHVHVVQKRPYQHHCSECINQKTELKNWKFLADPTALDQRKLTQRCIAF